MLLRLNIDLQVIFTESCKSELHDGRAIFISEDIRLDPVKIDAHESIKEMLKFFMGKNTPDRQEYIIRNLRFEHDIVEDGQDSADDDVSDTKTAAEPIDDSEAA